MDRLLRNHVNRCPGSSRAMQMGALGQFWVITPESKTTKSIPNLVTGCGGITYQGGWLVPLPSGGWWRATCWHGWHGNAAFLRLRVGGCILTHQGNAECPSSASWETCTGSAWARGSMEEHNQFTMGSNPWHLFNHVSCIYQDLCYIYIFINYLF